MSSSSLYVFFMILVQLNFSQGYDFLTLKIQVPSQKVIGDYLCRFGGPKYFLRRYVDP